MSTSNNNGELWRQSHSYSTNSSPHVRELHLRHVSLEVFFLRTAFSAQEKSFQDARCRKPIPKQFRRQAWLWSMRTWIRLRQSAFDAAIVRLFYFSPNWVCFVQRSTLAFLKLLPGFRAPHPEKGMNRRLFEGRTATTSPWHRNCSSIVSDSTWPSFTKLSQALTEDVPALSAAVATDKGRVSQDKCWISYSFVYRSEWKYRSLPSGMSIIWNSRQCKTFPISAHHSFHLWLPLLCKS